MAVVKRHGMEHMEMHGTPFMDFPLSLTGSRMHECEWNDTALCDWQYSYWRNWYEADIRYALSTVALFLVGIALFSAIYISSQLMPERLTQSKTLHRLAGLNRYLSYKAFRIPVLNWNSAPLGVLILGGIGAIYFFSMTLATKPYYWPNTETFHFGDSPPIATRSGWLSIGCMPFVFATAGKSNLITLCTGISHEKLQVFHRWIAYAFLVTALIHTFPFIVYNIQVGSMVESWKTSQFYWTGTVALLAQAWLTFASWGPIRNLCYEWFKLSHFIAVVVFMIFFFFHCDHILTSWHYFIATGVLFSVSWLHRQIRIYFEHGIGQRATLSLESNGFIRVTVPTRSTWRAGQHYFVRFLSLGLHAWSIHPFSACSLPEKTDIFEIKESELVFYIRPRTGFTGRLARYVELHPNCRMRVLLDGPYGGVDMRKIEQSQRSLVVAGGSGAGWIMPFIIAYLRRLELTSGDEKSEQQPSMRVILATRDVATRNWFEDAVQTLIESSHLDALPSGLELEVHFTGSEENREAPKASGQFLRRLEEPEKAVDAKVPTAEARSESESSEELKAKALDITSFESRPDLPSTIRDEAALTASGGSLGVFVCGPLSMQSDVTNVVAREQIEIAKSGSRDIYLHMEHFSWA